jgi:hypothetical protein
MTPAQGAVSLGVLGATARGVAADAEHIWTQRPVTPAMEAETAGHEEPTVEAA